MNDVMFRAIGSGKRRQVKVRIQDQLGCKSKAGSQASVYSVEVFASPGRGSNYHSIMKYIK